MHLRFTWRLITLATLVTYAMLVFVTLRFIVHSLAFAVIFALTSILLLYAAWLVISASGHSRSILGKGLFTIGIAAYVVELIYYFSERQHIRNAFGIIMLAIVYVLLVGLLRDRYWHLKRESVELMRQTAHFQHPVLIINPKSGNGRAVKAHVDTVAANMGVEVFFTKKDEKVEVTANRAIQEGADVLGISGGDGSIGAVAKVALKHDLPIVVLPGGTKCHFARDIGLDPKKIIDSLAAFSGVERRVDAAEINDRIFLNNVSLGLYADIVDHPDYRNHKLRVSWDVMHSIVSGKRDLYDLQFRKGSRRFKRAAEVLVGVNRYDMVDIFELGHREHLDEGVLQITVVAELNDKLVKNLISRVRVDKLRASAGENGLIQWTDQSLTLSNSLGVIIAGVDGEREKYMSPVKIRVLPKVLRVYVPAEGIRHRPYNPFSTLIIRKIWWRAMH